MKQRTLAVSEGRAHRPSVSRLKKEVARLLDAAPSLTSAIDIKQLRNEIHLTQADFAPLINVSVRTLSTMEGNVKTIGRQELKSIMEVRRLVNSLSEIMPTREVGGWLKTPNEAFGGFKPLELMERGEVDRLYEMIYILKSGIPG